jgi:hypothetical protein
MRGFICPTRPQKRLLDVIACVAIAAHLAGCVGIARSQTRNTTADKAVRQACAADYRSFCSGVRPGGGEIAAVLSNTRASCRSHAVPRFKPRKRPSNRSSKPFTSSKGATIMHTRLRSLGLGALTAAAVAVASFAPAPALAWGVIVRGPIFVGPRAVYVGPPYYAPPPVYVAPAAPVWVPGHWNGPYWVPAHWA